MRLSSWDLARSGCNSWGKDSYDAPNKFWWMIKTLWKVEKVCILNFNIVWILKYKTKWICLSLSFLALVTCWSWVRIQKQPLCICKGKAAYNIPPPYLRIAKSLWAMGYEVFYHFLPVDCSDWTNKSDLSWDTDRWQLSALFITPACLYWRIESDFPFIWIGKVNSPQPWWCFLLLYSRQM